MAEASSSTLAGLMRNVYLLFFPFLCFCFIFVLFFYCPSISFSLSFFLLHLLSERKSVRLSVVCLGRHSGYSYGTDVSRQDSGSTQVTVARTRETPPPTPGFCPTDHCRKRRDVLETTQEQTQSRQATTTRIVSFSAASPTGKGEHGNNTLAPIDAPGRSTAKFHQEEEVSSAAPIDASSLESEAAEPPESPIWNVKKSLSGATSESWSESSTTEDKCSSPSISSSSSPTSSMLSQKRRLAVKVLRVCARCMSGSVRPVS